jgi:hypothetical protein
MEKLIVAPRELKIVRTTSHIDSVVNAIEYTTKDGLKGIQLFLQELPYPVRILTNKFPKPASLIKCRIELQGTMREYQGKQYFDAKDIVVLEQSKLGLLVLSGASYSGDI